ncbi:Anthranilate synthase component II [Candidatus Johnevansia muelleri]|uniref:Anthranilate synthase component II n=1 Tax=Candidatus Johnevansia muelleri TaxID=1495769 RepID=A0A078KBM5_9GAMM|nr:Anthranilate synthase component II [Candidatus Evansia muelleri]
MILNKKVLIIDNYDSFTFNIVQYLGVLGVEVYILRNNILNIKEIENLYFTHIIISPGPSTPYESGISLKAIKYFTGKFPILGICLGHQAIAQAFGGKIIRSPKIMHGKTSIIYHKNEGIFYGLKNPLKVTRYHSLIIDKKSLPNCFNITALTNNNYINQSIIMGIKHKIFYIEGIQFHPESIMSIQGHELFKNFLKYP